MTIRELERRSGLERTNIRFYEKEGLLTPERKENGYRDYSEEDLQLLMKIKLLRRLNFSIESIRSLICGDTALEEALARRLEAIGMQRKELNATEQVCQEMKTDGAAFPTLDAQRYLDHYDHALRMPSSSASIRPTVPASDRIPTVNCPWRRYFARMMDLMLVSVLVHLVLALVFRVNVSNISTVVDWFLAFVEWALLIPLEGLLLSRFGTTPGKWILGIRVEHEDGRKLTFREAAERTWLVFILGAGANIPIFNIYRLWKSYKNAREGEESDWEWETQSTLVVPDLDIRRWRQAAYVGIYAAVTIITVLVCMLPGFRPPNRGSELTVEEFVENYNSMARFHWNEAVRLQTDGTFGVKTTSGTVVIDLDESEDLALQFEETDGVLTKVSFERDMSSWYRAGSVDAEGKRAIQLTTMAYAWADCGPVKASRNQEILNEFSKLTEGSLTREILGCELTYTITPLGETLDDSGSFWRDNWHVEFEFKPNA